MTFLQATDPAVLELVARPICPHGMLSLVVCSPHPRTCTRDGDYGNYLLPHR